MKNKYYSFRRDVEFCERRESDTSLTKIYYRDRGDPYVKISATQPVLEGIQAQNVRLNQSFRDSTKSSSGRLVTVESHTGKNLYLTHGQIPFLLNENV